MKTGRIILLVVAIAAGGLAAFLVTRGKGETPSPVAEVQVIKEASNRVLVASRDIGLGERLDPDLLQWQDWPESTIRPEYITDINTPDAFSIFSGTVARFEIFAGEPIREAKLVHTDDGGYMSAVLAKGMRGVSVGVSAASGAGGFINPNDRVDVLVSQRGSTTRTILQNVRVLAIGDRLGETGGTGGDSPQTFSSSTIATLELSPAQTEVIIAAVSQGDLSLVLRSVADFSEQVELARSDASSIRLIRYGAEVDVQSGAANAGDASNGGSESTVPPFTSALDPQQNFPEPFIEPGPDFGGDIPQPPLPGDAEPAPF